MTRDSFVALVGNATLLLLLVYVRDLLNAFHWVSKAWIRQVIAGIAIGAIGVFVMLMPWTFATGIIFDTRSVLLALSGLFFGTIPTVVAVLMTSAYRMVLDGSGMWTGVLLIVASGAIGLAWRRAQKHQLASLSFWTLYSLGLVVHVVMLALMFTLPLQTAIQVLRSITFPVLVVYPIATAAYGTLMVERLRREQGAAAIRESESRFRALFEQAAVGVAKAEARTGRLVLVNQHFADLLGYSPEEMLGMDLQTITHPDDRAETPPKMEELASGRISSFAQVKRYVRKDGGIIWVNLTISPLWAKGDPPDFAMAFVEDITDRKRAEEETQREQAFFDRLVESAPEGIAITDTQGRVMRVNAEFVRMFGYELDEAVGQDIDDLVAPAAREEEAREISKSTNQGNTTFFETVRRRKDGSLVDVSVIAAPVLIGGKPKAVYAIYRDITGRKQMEQKLEEMATHDSLTGLPNRRLLLDRFTVAAALARRNKVRLVVMSLDLDKFKSINDTLGHDAGDQVLKAIGTRLTGIVRASDTLARVGGDEFISVMMIAGHMEDANAIAKKILDSFTEPLSIAGHQLHLSTSIGIAIYPEDAEDLETLTKKSDAAMYYSKTHGRNQFKFYGDGNVQIG